MKFFLTLLIILFSLPLIILVGIIGFEVSSAVERFFNRLRKVFS